MVDPQKGGFIGFSSMAYKDLSVVIIFFDIFLLVELLFDLSILEPFMETSENTSSKGKFLIATVKGDVHDIGKNLVDIILTNNGSDVINLGIKQDVNSIIEAQKLHEADCIATVSYTHLTLPTSTLV